MSYFAVLSAIASTVCWTDTPLPEAGVRRDKAGKRMDQGCRDWLEPRLWGVHDLMVRLLGRCTCEDESRVVELYTVEGSVRDGMRISA